MSDLPVPSAICLKAALDETELTIPFRVITPMFGGGVRPLEADADDPIRESSIRGQLRFWWRAIHGARLATLEMMREREALIWGTASTSVEGRKKAEGGQGLVGIRVTPAKGLHPEPKYFADLSPGLRYAAFPLRPSNRGTLGLPLWVISSDADRTDQRAPHATLTVRVRQVSAYPGLEREVADTVTAWLLFGGIGGRTRRGFGAVEACETPGSVKEARDFLERISPRDGPEAATVVCDEHPSLPSFLAKQWFTRLPAIFADPLIALNAGLARLHQFRQGVGWGRDDAGHSCWPEADELKLVKEGQVPKGMFPRAGFGLPMSFPHHRGEKPHSFHLKPILSERWPSRLIIRPLRLQPGASISESLLRYACIALRLQASLGKGIELSSVRLRGGPWTVSPVAGPTGKATDPMDVQRGPKKATPITDAVDAFYEFFRLSDDKTTRD
jgi:CRISPR-associated protein Cmr1